MALVQFDRSNSQSKALTESVKEENTGTLYFTTDNKGIIMNGQPYCDNVIEGIKIEDSSSNLEVKNKVATILKAHPYVYGVVTPSDSATFNTDENNTMLTKSAISSLIDSKMSSVGNGEMNKVNDVYVDGTSVVGSDKIARITIPDPPTYTEPTYALSPNQTNTGASVQLTKDNVIISNCTIPGATNNAPGITKLASALSSSTDSAPQTKVVYDELQSVKQTLSDIQTAGGGEVNIINTIATSDGDLTPVSKKVTIPDATSDKKGLVTTSEINTIVNNNETVSTSIKGVSVSGSPLPINGRIVSMPEANGSVAGVISEDRVIQLAKTNVSGGSTYSAGKAINIESSTINASFDFSALSQPADGYAFGITGANGFNINTKIPKATTSTFGTIKLGYSQNAKNYPVELDTNGLAYVSVPWTGGSSNSGEENIINTVKVNGSALTVDSSKAVDIPAASRNVYGVVKMGTTLSDGNHPNDVVPTCSAVYSYAPQPKSITYLYVSDFDNGVINDGRAADYLRTAFDEMKDQVQTRYYILEGDFTGASIIHIHVHSNTEIAFDWNGYQYIATVPTSGTNLYTKRIPLEVNSVPDATTSVKGIVKLDNSIFNNTSSTTAATPNAVKIYVDRQTYVSKIPYMILEMNAERDQTAYSTSLMDLVMNMDMNPGVRCLLPTSSSTQDLSGGYTTILSYSTSGSDRIFSYINPQNGVTTVITATSTGGSGWGWTLERK